MKKQVKRLIANPLISGSTIVLVGTFIANVLSYLYTISMANFLSGADFGVLASLIAIINIVSIFASTVMTVFTKFSASFVGQKKEHLLGTLFIKGNIWVGTIAFGVAFILIFFAGIIAKFLHITNVGLIYIVSLTLLFAFLMSVGHGMLQGLLKFVANSSINIISSFIKFGLAIVMVYAGFNVFGAIFAVFMANFIGYFIMFVVVKKYLKTSSEREASITIPNLSRSLLAYGLPVFLSSLGITAFVSLDIILVKHFFSEETAGDYAKLSLMGRSIFYLVIPITSASFPLFAQKKERKEKLLGTLILALALVGIPSFVISIIYFLFPELIIYIFTPAQPAFSVAPLLGIFSIFILFFACSYVLNNFYLSIGKTRVFIFTMIGLLIEVLYITFFHQSLYQVILGLTGISLLLLIALLAYYPFAAHD